jgi:lactosylceramide 4-alpha-galactosyltransferase
VTNPSLDVFFLFTNPVKSINPKKLSIVKALLSYENVYMYQLDMMEYARNTPLEDFIRSKTLSKSHYVDSHTSDAMRFLTLWKYSGTYLDSDVLVLQSVKKFGTNFAGIQADGLINTAVLNLHGDLGRALAKRSMGIISEKFNVASSLANGPDIFTYIIKEMCGVSSPNQVERWRCYGFKIYNREACYAIKWNDWELFFLEDKLNQVLESTKDSLVFHLWNRLSSQKPLSTRSKAYLAHQARKFCPRVLAASGDFF